jgi:apolipoprotein N-acyltransferase
MTWFREHPRKTLAVAWALFGLACLAIATTDVSLWLLVGTGGLLVMVNGMTLRERHRSQMWLWFYIIGAGIIPLLVALLAPDKQTTESVIQN